MKKLSLVLGLLLVMLFTGCSNPIAFDNAKITHNKVRNVATNAEMRYESPISVFCDFDFHNVYFCKNDYCDSTFIGVYYRINGGETRYGYISNDNPHIYTFEDENTIEVLLRVKVTRLYPDTVISYYGPEESFKFVNNTTEHNYIWLEGTYNIDNFGDPYLQVCVTSPEEPEQYCLDLQLLEPTPIEPGASIAVYGYINGTCYMGPVFITHVYGWNTPTEPGTEVPDHGHHGN